MMEIRDPVLQRRLAAHFAKSKPPPAPVRSDQLSLASVIKDMRVVFDEGHAEEVARVKRSVTAMHQIERAMAEEKAAAGRAQTKAIEHVATKTELGRFLAGGQS
jgi:hypothetical protein